MNNFFQFLIMIMLMAGWGICAEKPNVIFILMDDMGYSDISCYGAKKVKTPHIDQLAKEGLKFTDCHTGQELPQSEFQMVMDHKPSKINRVKQLTPNWFKKIVDIKESYKKAYLILTVSMFLIALSLTVFLIRALT